MPTAPRIIRSAALVLAVLCLPALAAAQEPFAALRPLASSAGAAAQAQVQHEPYVTRSGAVVLSSDVFLPPQKEEGGKRRAAAAAFKGRSMQLSFFEGEPLVVVVDRESRPAADVLSLTGRQEGRDLSTLSMTVSSTGYRILYRDLDRNLVYKVTGDTQTGQGQVTVIDLKAMPPSRDLPALVPPKK